MLTEEALRGASMEVQKFLVESVPEEETPHQFSEKFEKKMKRIVLWNRVKRWIPTVLFVTVALAIFIYCKATDDDTLWHVPLSDEAKEQLNHAFVLQYYGRFAWECPTELGDEPYYGTINSCMIFRTVQMPVWDTEIGRLEVAGYVFYWYDPLRLYAYRDGEFCLLEEAYEKGWLTEVHIEKIYHEHQERIVLLQEGTQEMIKREAQRIEEILQGK